MHRDTATAEDLAQEVFLRIYRARKDYLAGAKFTTWLFRLATNLALNSVATIDTGEWKSRSMLRPKKTRRRFRYPRERCEFPPGRQQQIRQNLQKWNNLTPEQKNALRERAQRWQQLSPEDRQKVRNELLPKWQEMMPERRQAVNGKLHTLQGMSAADREKALDDPKFMQGLNPDEQSMVRSLSTLRSSPAAQ